MSEILDLAKDFEKKSKQQASSTEKALNSEFHRHQKFIETALKRSDKAISSAIKDHTSKAQKSIQGKQWRALIPFVLGMLLASMVAAGIWYMSSDHKLIKTVSAEDGSKWVQCQAIQDNQWCRVEGP